MKNILYLSIFNLLSSALYADEIGFTQIAANSYFNASQALKVGYQFDPISGSTPFPCIKNVKTEADRLSVTEVHVDDLLRPMGIQTMLGVHKAEHFIFNTAADSMIQDIYADHKTSIFAVTAAQIFSSEKADPATLKSLKDECKKPFVTKIYRGKMFVALIKISFKLPRDKAFFEKSIEEEIGLDDLFALLRNKSASNQSFVSIAVNLYERGTAYENMFIGRVFKHKSSVLGCTPNTLEKCSDLAASIDNFLTSKDGFFAEALERKEKDKGDIFFEIDTDNVNDLNDTLKARGSTFDKALKALALYNEYQNLDLSLPEREEARRNAGYLLKLFAENGCKSAWKNCEKVVQEMSLKISAAIAEKVESLELKELFLKECLEPSKASTKRLMERLKSETRRDCEGIIKNADKIRVLELQNFDIGDLSLIQIFTLLENLDISENSIRDLSPILNLRNLRLLIVTKSLVSDTKSLEKLAKSIELRDAK